MQTIRKPVIGNPTFGALCPRCNTLYGTQNWGAPWTCPSCTKTERRMGTWADDIDKSWGAGS